MLQVENDDVCTSYCTHMSYMQISSSNLLTVRKQSVSRYRRILVYQMSHNVVVILKKYCEHAGQSGGFLYL